MSRQFVTRLYALGSNGEGQLGVGHRNDLSQPQSCRFLTGNGNVVYDENLIVATLPTQREIKKLVAGGNHTLLLTQCGCVFSAGNEVNGRCVRVEKQDSTSVFEPIPWASGRHITDIAATWEASFLVEDSRKVWACGTGPKGELGLGEGNVCSSTPQVMFDVGSTSGEDCHIVAISGSLAHIMLVLSNGTVHGWGSSRKGQLGSNLTAQKTVWRPEIVELPFAASGLATGRDFSLIWQDFSTFILLGSVNLDGASLALTSSPTSPRVDAGWSTIYVILDGKILGFGLGRRGQLPPATLPSITNFASGSEHCIALTEDSRVVAWGWGEHGNCGLPLDDKSNVRDRFNNIALNTSQGEKVAGVAAGCASSFIWTTSDANPN